MTNSVSVGDLYRVRRLLVVEGQMCQAVPRSEAREEYLGIGCSGSPALQATRGGSPLSRHPLA